jgi:bifunctional DNA-binding transcriptional regulator/antitoxin component of YhaV-PrlF toxin-antitoxin module
MEQFHLAVKDKGRTVLPVGLQRACGFAPGATLVARPLGRGRFIVESSEAVLERIWSRMPEAGSTGGVEELHDWRRESERRRRERLEAEFRATEDSERRGAVLLQHLGQE